MQKLFCTQASLPSKHGTEPFFFLLIRNIQSADDLNVSFVSILLFPSENVTGCTLWWCVGRERERNVQSTCNNITIAFMLSCVWTPLKVCFLFIFLFLFQGCGDYAEAEQVFKMETTQLPTKQNRGYFPPPLLRKQGLGENGRGFMSPLARYWKYCISATVHSTFPHCY